MNDVLSWLDGKKTYICGLVCAAAIFAHSQEWIGREVLEILLATFGAGTIAALRSSINRKDDKKCSQL